MEMIDKLDPMHPGEVLEELYLDPLDISAGALSRILGVPRTRIERVIKGKTRVTPDTACRLAKALGTTPTYWMNMQTSYDLAKARRNVDVSRIKPLDGLSPAAGG